MTKTWISRQKLNLLSSEQKKSNFLLDGGVTFVTIIYITDVTFLERTMKKTPKISEAEWEVMKALWKRAPLTANAIVDELTGQTHWKRETIRTLINRLVQKKAVDFEKKGRQYHYFPLVTEAECIKAEARTFLKRLGSGLIEPMLVAFVEEENLSGERIARLRRILKKAADENRKAEK